MANVLSVDPSPDGAAAAVLPEREWLSRARAHEERVDEWVQPHLQRRRTGQTHPVEDFLFDYYHLSPAKLRRWHPGAGIVLAGPAGGAYLGLVDYRAVAGGVATDPVRLSRHTGRLTDVLRLLTATASRPPSYGCFGLHEWAMVYRSGPDAVRHPGLPLRLDRAATDAVVEAGPLRCTHIDAYRFFTLDAVPLNSTRPTRATQPDLEQPGCLHAGMDLYKWAGIFHPFVGADLVADCFAHARDVRALDMAASPYDLSALGYPAVAVETAQGRTDYIRQQRGFAESGALLRDRLIEVLTRLRRAGLRRTG